MQVIQWAEKQGLSIQHKGGLRYQIGDTEFTCLADRGVLLDRGGALQLTKEERQAGAPYAYLLGSKGYYCNGDNMVDSLSIRYNNTPSKLHNMVYLGIHSEGEVGNGSGLYADWVKKAKSLGYKGIGFCERDTLISSYSFYKLCKANDLTCAIGLEFLVRWQGKENIVKAFCIGQAGWTTLLKIHHEFSLNNRRFEWSELPKDGVIFIWSRENPYCTLPTGVYRQLDFCLYEDVNYCNQLRVNDRRYFLQDVPHMLCFDSYYLDRDMDWVQDYCNFIGKSRINARAKGRHLLSISDIRHGFIEQFKNKDLGLQVLRQAAKNLNKYDFNIDLGAAVQIERLKMPSCYDDDKAKVMGVLESEIERRFSGNSEYRDRLDSELKVIGKGGFYSYFAILYDIIDYCEENNILCGVGRGSAGGSLVSYLLGITRIDPIQHGLLFERFLNEARITIRSLPDIDMDFPKEKREEIIRYLESRYGDYKVSHVSVDNRAMTRNTLTFLSKFFNIEPPTALDYKRFLPQVGDTARTKFATDVHYHAMVVGCAGDDTMKSFARRYPKVIDSAYDVFGMLWNRSVHASAIIVSDIDLRTILPMYREGDRYVTEWNGPILEEVGFLKNDILSLTQLDKIQKVFNLIEVNRGETLNYDVIPIDDAPTYKSFGEGYTVDTLHFSSAVVTEFLITIKPKTLFDLATALSIVRPGPKRAGIYDKFVKRRQGKDKVSFDLPGEEYKAIVKDTEGLIIYQEQVIRLFMILGFTAIEADNIRKKMGKSEGAGFDEIKGAFIEKGAEKGYDRAALSKYLDELAGFSVYAFNLSHATAYALTGYIFQYLKVNYPLEFWTVSLQEAKREELYARMIEMRRLGLGDQVRYLDINDSEENFTSKGGYLYFGFGLVKGISENGVNKILEYRKKVGGFLDLSDFLNLGKITKTITKSLILAGAFDRLEGSGNRAHLLNQWALHYKEKPLQIRNFSVAEKDILGWADFDFQELTKGLTKAKYREGFTDEDLSKVISWAGHVDAFITLSKNGRMYGIANLIGKQDKVTVYLDAKEMTWGSGVFAKGNIVAVQGKLSKKGNINYIRVDKSSNAHLL